MPPDVTSGRIGQRMCNGRLINLICELGLSACKFWRETMCSELCSPALHLDVACKVLNDRRVGLGNADAWAMAIVSN